MKSLIYQAIGPAIALSALTVSTPALASQDSTRLPPQVSPYEPYARPAQRQLQAVAVGFSGDARMRQSLQSVLARTGRYQVEASAQIPAGPTGLFVSGRIQQMNDVHGWVSCQVRYFVASQPDKSAQLVDTAAASVPMLPVHIFKDRAEVRQIAQDACIGELAAQIAGHLAGITESTQIAAEEGGPR